MDGGTMIWEDDPDYRNERNEFLKSLDFRGARREVGRARNRAKNEGGEVVDYIN